MEDRASQLGRRRSLASVIAASALLASVLAAPGAAAEPEFPGQLQSATAMACAPACTLCHTDPAGGADHLRANGVWAPWAAVAQGIAPADMLATLDTDKDGANDLDELKAGTDPGSANNTLICMPNYGCFASRIARSTGRSGSADGAGAALALAVAAVCVLAGRRRRRAG